MFAISANKKISFILKQSSSFKFFRCIGNRLFTQTFFAFNIQNVFPIFYVHFSNEFGKDSIKIIFSQSLKNLQIKKKAVFNLQFRGSQPVSCVPPEILRSFPVSPRDNFADPFTPNIFSSSVVAFKYLKNLNKISKVIRLGKFSKNCKCPTAICLRQLPISTATTATTPTTAATLSKSLFL